ncbi:hypothetical protein MUN82_01245 [Hymenobacter aerilatus]|uniref:Uncharacterized protein n=1 Tax=Hymenobacter aerilatus TaxID=2932251 RepID=A0A8T9SZS8_9BACT|nr:hypothetical protein [Hymenobacter aerilatus]UOR05740.1 hypothetical protein MUN82_01245 [Hymenobacter aerilatus]
MKKAFTSSVFLLLLSTLLSVLPLATQAQCVLCKSQVEASRTEKDGYDVTGLNKGIVYLMTVPYLLMGTVGYFWYRNVQKKKVAQQ